MSSPRNLINGDTWVISDTHFYHNNIIKYCKRPWDHDELMIRNWNSIVAKDDLVLHLGDWGVWYGENKLAALYLGKQLAGTKIMVRGNHDKASSVQFMAHGGIHVTRSFTHTTPTGVKIHFSHAGRWPKGDYDYNIHGHSHNNAEKWYDWRENMSVEVSNYQPERLRDVLRRRGWRDYA